MLPFINRLRELGCAVTLQQKSLETTLAALILEATRLFELAPLFANLVYPEPIPREDSIPFFTLVPRNHGRVTSGIRLLKVKNVDRNLTLREMLKAPCEYSRPRELTFLGKTLILRLGLCL